MECIELNWLCKLMKKVKSCQAAIVVLNWVKHGFSLWVSLKKSKAIMRSLCLNELMVKQVCEKEFDKLIFGR